MPPKKLNIGRNTRKSINKRNTRQNCSALDSGSSNFSRAQSENIDTETLRTNRSQIRHINERFSPRSRSSESENERINSPRRNLELERGTENRLRRLRSSVRRYRESDSQEERNIRRNEIRGYHTRQRETEVERERRLRSSRSERNNEIEDEESQISIIRDGTEILQLGEIREETETRVRANKNQWIIFNKKAFHYTSNINIEQNQLLSIGRRNKQCTFCNALKWSKEAPSICCSNGKVILAQLEVPPEPLFELYQGETADSKIFLKNIRTYNNIFQMTSFGTTKEVREQGFMPTFKIQGQIYHYFGSLFPAPDQERKYLQVYFVGGDPIEETRLRCRNISNIDQKLVMALQNLFHSNNNYVRSFKTAIERAPREENFSVVIHADRTPLGEHERRFNAPVVNEVAIVISGQQYKSRDVIIHSRTNQIQRIMETHRSYDALQYPLIFWRGDDGYHFQIFQIIPGTEIINNNKKVSAMQFYSFRFMFRPNEFNLILKARNLLNQFAVDMYAKIETERLCYIRTNQAKLRAEEYIHLRDAIANDIDPLKIGQAIILPSTFVGGPRYMFEHTQDAMTYVRVHGRPSLFITFTCNPKWEEIKSELLPNQAPTDRHDIISRVFHLKVSIMMNLITKGCVFGEMSCYMYSIEWQKRGLPHVHILIWLKEKIRPVDVDKIICAEFPDPSTDKELYDIISAQMVHGPCGMLNLQSPCMKDGKCTKNYPKKYVKETQAGEDGYPLYRRRSEIDGGFSMKLKMKSGNEITVDNKWIVPYCPYLSRIFNAHINVEFCHSVKSIKYVCKYINKGSDYAIFSVSDKRNDEISTYQLGRYLSSNESFWRIFSQPIHERYPSVVHLQVHLENGQRVYFTKSNIVTRASNPPETTLTAFFRLCSNDNFAKTLLYSEVPKYYTWNKSAKEFKRRVMGVPVEGFPGVKSTDTLGRVYSVHPRNFECLCLRLLLHEVRGPTSFTNLKTVDGFVCPTFRDACQRLGLLLEDAHWDKTLAEAKEISSASKLRNLFAVMLTACELSDPLSLWQKYKEYMSEDIMHRLASSHEMPVTFTAEIFNYALQLLENEVILISGNGLAQYNLPVPQRGPNDIFLNNNEIYNTLEQSIYVAENEARLIPDQLAALQIIMERVEKGFGSLIFLDAPGGTGKTFLLNLLLAKIRQTGEIAIAVASSGIAATLLTGGQTAHSAFRIPLNVIHSETPTCYISKSSVMARKLQNCRLIVWDEITMAHKKSVEALEFTLRDIRENPDFMGGVTLVISGDFRQTLPIVPRGTPADELNACIKNSHLWSRVEQVQLKINLRAYISAGNLSSNFSNVLLNIGDGLIPHDLNGLINIPPRCGVTVQNLNELLNKIYPDINEHYMNCEWLCERAILAPTNDIVNKINIELVNQLQGSETVYKSIDCVTDQETAVNFPIEFLNSLELPGMPSHNLILKTGTPIVLLRNLNTPKLCNGTRLCVTSLKPNIIQATILTGCAKGENVLIPRIPLISIDLPFEFKRLQFPIKVAFALTINKSQGQTLNVAGLYLEHHCFSHGQLYVGCSRVGNSENLYIYAPEGKTKNIVYKQALSSHPS